MTNPILITYILQLADSQVILVQVKTLYIFLESFCDIFTNKRAQMATTCSPPYECIRKELMSPSLVSPSTVIPLFIVGKQ